jgi:hypothetical protein
VEVVTGHVDTGREAVERLARFLRIPYLATQRELAKAAAMLLALFARAERAEAEIASIKGGLMAAAVARLVREERDAAAAEMREACAVEAAAAASSWTEGAVIAAAIRALPLPGERTP